jgi:hypothetical protein
MRSSEEWALKATLRWTSSMLHQVYLGSVRNRNKTRKLIYLQDEASGLSDKVFGFLRAFLGFFLPIDLPDRFPNSL